MTETFGCIQDVPHCLLAPVANVNVSLGMAALLRESRGGNGAANVKAEGGTTSVEEFASEAGFKLAAGEEYVLSISIETTRTEKTSVPVAQLSHESGAVSRWDG